MIRQGLIYVNKGLYLALPLYSDFWLFSDEVYEGKVEAVVDDGELTAEFGRERFLFSRGEGVDVEDDGEESLEAESLSLRAFWR